MKIADNIGNLFSQSAKNRSEKTNPNQSFSEVLVQVARTSAEGSSSLKAGSIVPTLGAPDPVTLSTPVSPIVQSARETMPSAGVIEELETILHTFDHYRLKLRDESVPLDDLADIIGHFEERIGRLQVLNASATTPKGLKEVASGLMITMATEIEKYRRGDYV